MPFESDFNEPKDRYFSSEDLDFKSGDSPVVLDIVGSLGIASIDSELYCIALVNTGNILVELSFDGSTYGDQFTLFYLERLALSGFKIKKIRITHSGTNSGYRIIAR